MVITTKEVAEILRYDTTRPVLRLFQSGEIAAKRVGKHGHWRTTTEALEKYLSKIRHIEPIRNGGCGGGHIPPGLPAFSRRVR